MNAIGKIVVSGGWGYGNIGDEAILKYTYLDLKRAFPRIPIIVLSYDPDETCKHHAFSAKKSLHRVLKDMCPQGIPEFCMELIERGDQEKVIREYVDLFSNDTLFIMAGGGYFNSFWKESIYSHLCEIAIACRKGAKTAMIGQTIGPLSKNQQKLVKGILSKVDYIDVRDKTSHALLTVILKNKTIHLSSDAAVRVGEHNKATGSKKQIGIMYQRIRPYTGPQASFIFYRIRQCFNLATGKVHRFSSQFAELINMIKKEYPNYEICFIQSTEWQKEKVNKLRSQVGLSISESLHGDTVEELIHAISETDLIITTNMHPAIISTSMGIPALVISHTYKFDDYVSSIGQEACLFHKMNARRLLKTASKVMDNQEIYRLLRQKNQILRSKLDEVYTDLAKLVSKE